MQTELLEGLAANFATNEYRLLVIDSVMSLYRTDYVGRGELSERQQVLGTFLRRATQMAEEFNLVVLMVSSCFVKLCQDSLTIHGLTKSCPILVPVHCSQESMVASLLEGIYLPMLQQLDFCFARVEVRSVSLRLWTHLVSGSDFLLTLRPFNRNSISPLRSNSARI